MEFSTNIRAYQEKGSIAFTVHLPIEISNILQVGGRLCFVLRVVHVLFCSFFFCFYAGSKKPWLQNVSTLEQDAHDPKHRPSPSEQWLYSLREVEQRLNVSLSIDFMGVGKNQQPVGKFCNPENMIRHILAKKHNRWSIYVKS